MKNGLKRATSERGVCLFFSLIFMLLILFPQTAGATTAQQYINQGKAQLFSTGEQTVEGALAAYQTFYQANQEHGDRCTSIGVPSWQDCSLSDAEQKAKIHGYLAFTRLLDLMFRQDNPVDSIDTVTELLAQYGISRTGNNFDALNFDSPLSDYENVILPESSPSGETIRSFIAGPLLTALNASIADMDEVIHYCGIAGEFGFSTREIITKEEIGHDADKDIEVDEGDYYLFRASLKLAKAFALVASAYDLDVDIREIAALINTENLNPKNFLERYPDLLNLLTTSSTPSVDGANQLADAKIAFLGAIQDYLAASDKIRNDNDTAAGAEELIAIDECELRSEEWFRTNLAGIQTSLNNGTPFAFTYKEETWEFIDGADQTKKIRANFWENMAAGNWYALTDCNFIGCGGAIDCITINGDQITLEFEGGGPDGWTEATFTGTLDSVNGQITGGNYEGTDNSGYFSGTFTATRTNVEEETYNINLNPFFGAPGPYNLRDFLPLFNECGEPIPGTVGQWLPNGPDATLGGILPDFTTQDWELDYMPSGTIEIPEATINVQDGSINDWAGMAPVFTDLTGEDDPDLQGSDLHYLYLAKDADFLYVRMTLADGPPNTDVNYNGFYNPIDETWHDQAMHYFVQFRPNPEQFKDIRYNGVRYDGSNWVVMVHQQSTPNPLDMSGFTEFARYDSGYAQAVGNDLEWKVPLSEVGPITGNFLTTWLHWTPGWEQPSDNNPTCLRIGPLSSVSGTLNVSQHDGTGPIYIGVFRYDGTYNTHRENRIGGEIIYEGEYTADMTYTVNDLPVGEEVFVAARWDADFNGIKTFGDYVGKTGSITVASGGTSCANLLVDTLIGFSGQEKVYPVKRGDKGDEIYLGFWAKIPGAQSVSVSEPGISTTINLSRRAMYQSWWTGGIPVSNLAGAAIQTGTYTFTATSSADSSVQTTTTFNLTSVPSTPEPAILVSPYEGTPDIEMSLTDNTPTFTWTAASGAQAHKLRINQNIGGNWSWIYDSGWGTTGNTHTVETPLPTGVHLRWYVDAYDSADWGSTTAMSRSVRQKFTISLSGGVKVGDLNDDISVTLADAILGLKVMAGMNPAGIRSNYATSGVDVNGDNKIGLAEVVYILQYVAGLR